MLIPGLAAPVDATASYVPRLDGYFLRTAAADCPAEGLSAFALEADDMRILLRDVTCAQTSSSSSSQRTKDSI
eukprot:SAG31_NODE_2830_length_5027_cov_3.418425_7_plen_73_part_00